MTFSSAQLAGFAREAGFDLVGFARAEAIPPSTLNDWLAQGFHADMDWLAARAEERLDVTKLYPGARTVMALACNYWHSDDASVVARYAQGRDYHATMKDRLRTLRRLLRERLNTDRCYATVDVNPVMEKVWAVRAGLGTITNNGCLATPQFGSYVVLAVLILPEEVDAYATPLDEDVCGTCTLCLDACPTKAIVSPRVVDARACLSYQTIENAGAVPEALRPALTDQLFGCDLCQDVCPLNQAPVKADARFEPRPLSKLSALQLAGMTRAQYDEWIPGSPLARAGFDGLRRNAAYVLGATKCAEAREVLQQLKDDPSERVRDAANWALSRLG